MVILGLLFIAAGALVIVAAFASNDPGTGGEILGFELTTLETFLLGVAAGGVLLLGVSILKWGTKRSLAHRRERKELNRLNERLDRAESEKRGDDVPDEKI